MVIRTILRYLANHPQLVDSLAESRFMRRLAQITAYGILKAQEKGHEAVEKASESETIRRIAEQKDTSQNRIASFKRTFAVELQKEIKEFQEKIKKGELEDKHKPK
ncbi:protein NCBP2AS2 homolog [Apostichopus japonicus]|uniref:protein NCBP2AS2 homolog n=1 Tax=Stichopus japonicus TaxID=307972 RepID=UPI003AB8598A